MIGESKTKGNKSETKVLNAALDSSIKSKLKAMEELYKEDPVKYNIYILCTDGGG